MTTKKKYPRNYVPPSINLPHVSGVLDPAVRKNYPVSFDLRKLNRITPVENQGDRNDCWLYATTSSLESTVLSEEQVNYSEYQLNDAGGFDVPVGEGGNYYMSAAILARWAGPVAEPVYHRKGPDGRSEKRVQVHRLVQRVMFLPNRVDPLDNDTIKYFLGRYGAVYADMYKVAEHLHSPTHAYYCPEPEAVNHAVSIVGWDDAFPADRFIEPPPGDGAFIIKNSYGTEFGEDGFFYVSYYDRSLRVGASFNSVVETDRYIRNYQYDPLGHTASTGFMSVEGWAANIFEAREDSVLKAVAFYTNDANVEIEISIFTSLTGDSPIAGDRVVGQVCKKIYPGYYTEVLADPPALKKGQTFSIVICFRNSKYIRPLAIEDAIGGHSSRASAEPGQSYVSADGKEWYDLTSIKPRANVCIKGFTAWGDK